MNTYNRVPLQEGVNQIEDFFNFLEVDPKHGTFAYAEYVAPVSLNKTYVEDGVKMLNPLYGKLYKYSKFKFNYGEVYAEAMKKRDPEYTPGVRRGKYEKLQGYDVLESGKSGLYLPIHPKGSTPTAYIVEENGKYIKKSKEEIAKYLKPVSSFDPEALQRRQLIVDRIYKLTASGAEWKNPNFAYKAAREVAPQQEAKIPTKVGELKALIRETLKEKKELTPKV